MPAYGAETKGMNIETPKIGPDTPGMNAKSARPKMDCEARHHPGRFSIELNIPKANVI